MALSFIGTKNRPAASLRYYRSRWSARRRREECRWLRYAIEGTGDTLRVSLAADPVEEIKVGFDILKSLRIRSRGINFIVCPSCSRQEFDVIGTVNALEQRLEDILTPMDVSIIGCVVTARRSRRSDFKFTGARNMSGLYEDGKRKNVFLTTI